MSLALLVRWPHRLNGRILWGLVICTLVNAHWVVFDDGNRSNYLIGYYLWMGSFLVLAVGARSILKRRPVDIGPFKRPQKP